VMAYLANLFAGRWVRPIMAFAFAGLLAVLLLGFAISAHGSVQTASLTDKLLVVAILVGPLFFSGIVFSTLLKRTQSIAAAMSYNLMGAMLGGALEYNSMRFGFSSLYLIAFLLYGLAWMCLARDAKNASRAEPQSV